MAYQHTEIRKFLGLYLQQNSFDIPDGALEQCVNCTIDQQDVIKKRRGYYNFFTPSAGTLNNLETYQDNLLALFDSKISRISSLGVETVLTGETVDETGRTGRFVQQNDNDYFTSNNGVMKLESYQGPVWKSGVPPGLDLRGKFLAANGPVASDAQTAWRILFGRRDSNKNLLLSVPSDILVLTNAKVEDQTATEAATTVTVTTSVAHNLSTGMTITVSGAVDGGGTPVTGVDGEHIITVLTASTFTFTSAGTAPTLAKLSYGNTREARLEFSIPSEINSTDYFYQVYRSSPSNSALAAPTADFKLVVEAQLTALDLSEEVVFYDDDVLDQFLGAELYTNPNSREGELQANERAPLCQDVTIFKNMMFYGNCTSRHALNLAVVSTSNTIINNNDFIEIKLGATTRKYVARTGVGNSTVTAESVAGAGTITITYTAHGLVNGDTVLVSNTVGTLTQGEYVISGVTANTFDIVPGGAITASSLDFEGVKNTLGVYFFQLVNPTLSVAQGLDSTARGIVRAVNRDTSSLVYSRYASSINDVPGKMFFQAKGFGGAFSFRANTLTVGTAFAPELPDSFSTGLQVTSENDDLRNVFFVSKLGEPEAVPLVNNYPVGSRNYRIDRIIALTDAIVVLKADGVFVINGDSPTNLAISLLDGTTNCLAPNSAVALNNEVYYLGQQGICKASANAVAIVSGKIDVPIIAVLGTPTLASQSSAVGYSSENYYILTTLDPRQTTATVTYCYNASTNAFTTWDELFKMSSIGPENKMFTISLDNKIRKERKNQNRLDYTGDDFAVTNVVSVGADKLSAVITVSGTTPAEGDVILKGNILSRIASAVSVGPNYAVTFEFETNLLVSDTATLYKPYESVIKLSPYHAGQVNRGKVFSQFQVHTRDQSITALTISFGGDTFSNSEQVTWKANKVLQTSGWGLLPWGTFPWGQESTINLNYATQAAPTIRTYIPLYGQRTTFIQPILSHKQAAEPLLIQSMGFQLRGLGERVSK